MQKSYDKIAVCWLRSHFYYSWCIISSRTIYKAHFNTSKLVTTMKMVVGKVKIT